ncbi:HNH endonuclease [Streptomyces vinaceus]|uniref:HNH endonuclease n=1 Tax=Streptomyces vinaceus TaxID=1960 RepID=UPI003690CF6D
MSASPPGPRWSPPAPGAPLRSHGWGGRQGEREGLGPGWRRRRAAAWREAGGLCQHLRYDTGLPCVAAGAAVDHIIPVSQGGSSEPSNLQVLCKYHHDRKTALEAAEGRRKARAARDIPRGKRILGSL